MTIRSDETVVTLFVSDVLYNTLDELVDALHALTTGRVGPLLRSPVVWMVSAVRPKWVRDRQFANGAEVWLRISACP
jgi:hypothetical protein